MFVEMIPARTAAMTSRIVYLTDVAMAVGIWALLTAIMRTIGGKYGFAFLSFPFIIFLQLVYAVVRRTEETGAADPENKAQDDQGEEPKSAPMGLTKVSFTGFLAVSVRAISGGSPSDWTVSFLVFAAAAIASGVSWRLLTHKQNKDKVGGEAAAEEAANIASFCTHFCVAVATVLFAVMVWKAGAAREEVSAACAHVYDVTCVHLNKILDAHHMRNMCTCIDPCRN
jgi:membrane protein implicated in regulation of membrane protease activity